MKKIWILMEGYTDGCTYNSEVPYSVHDSEEGAFLAQAELDRLQSVPYPECGENRGTYTEIREFEVKP